MDGTKLKLKKPIFDLEILNTLQCKMRIKNLFFWLISMLLSSGIFGQTNDDNSSAIELNTFYNQHINKTAILYSGPAYIPQRFPMVGTPFIGSDSLSLGWISYDGQYYKDVPLQWDVFQNYVLTQSLLTNARMILRNELIDSFFFAGHLVKFMPRNKENNLLNEGLYDILYAGPTTLMARRKKVVQARSDKNVLINDMIDKHLYYIRKKGIYYQAGNKKDVAYLFAKDLPEIKRVVRRNNLKWKKNIEQILMIAVVHYDKAKTIK